GFLDRRPGGCAWVAFGALICRHLQTRDREIRGIVMPPGIHKLHAGCSSQPRGHDLPQELTPSERTHPAAMPRLRPDTDRASRAGSYAESRRYPIESSRRGRGYTGSREEGVHRTRVPDTAAVRSREWRERRSECPAE